MALVHQFCSGITRGGDFAAVTGAGLAPGLIAGDIRGALGEAVFAHVTQGGALFVDSGAFPAFTGSGPAVDFVSVLSLYSQLVAVAPNVAALYLVAPDKVGDSAATVQLLEEHAFALRGLVEQGASLIVPLHSASATPAATWARQAALFAGLPIVPGIPMRAHGANIDEVVTFLQDSGARAVHLLGTSKSAHVGTLAFFLPGVSVTADANRIRAAVGEGREATEDYRAAVSDACAEARANGMEGAEDVTDFVYEALNTPGALTRSEIEHVVEFIGDIPGVNIREAVRDARLNDCLFEGVVDMLIQCVIEGIYRDRIARAVGPQIRQTVLTRVLAGSRAA